MKLADIVTIFEYNYWANRLILTAAARVAPEQFAAPTAFPRSGLRGTLVHIMDTEFGWRTMIENARHTDHWNAPELLETEFPTLTSIEARWREEESDMRRFLAACDDERMMEIVRYVTDEGNTRERVLWHCLYHIVNHGTQHRSEAAAILTDYGQSPGDVDFTFFLNQHPQPAS